MANSLVVEDFSLRHTLECGQFFRWNRASEDVYEVQRKDVSFRVWQEGGRLYFTDVSAGFVKQFFSLDHDLPAITRAIDRDPWMHAAIRRYWGLRILRQDPWECTAAFVTSIASNIPRITRNIEDMTGAFGIGRQFPLPEELGSEQRLRALRLGFRAKYLVDAARLAGAGLLEDIESMSERDGRDALMVIPGVAEKVADCVLLYAYGRLGAFPVDTWIRKVMRQIYFEGRRASDERIRHFASHYFGRYAGYAQQYLYVYSREHWDEIAAKSVPKSDTAVIRDLASKVMTTRVLARAQRP